MFKINVETFLIVAARALSQMLLLAVFALSYVCLGHTVDNIVSVPGLVHFTEVFQLVYSHFIDFHFVNSHLVPKWELTN